MPTPFEKNRQTRPDLFYTFKASQAEIDDPDTETYVAPSGHWLPHKDISTLEGYTGKHLACMRHFVVDGKEVFGRLDLGLYADTGALKIYFLSAEYYDQENNVWIDPKNNAVHIADLSALARMRTGGVDYEQSIDFGVLGNFTKNAAGTVTSAYVQKNWQAIASCFGMRVWWSRGPLEMIWYLDVPGKYVQLVISCEVFSENYFVQRAGDAGLRDIITIEGADIAQDTTGPNRIVSFTYPPTASPFQCAAADGSTWKQRYVAGAGLIAK